MRVYRPQADEPLPVVVYFHGGGWVIGDIATHDTTCQRLAAGVPAVVVSVDYRLAPEHRFPAAVDDCDAATAWVSAHAAELGGDATRLAVAGDSAGGNLAAVIALRARDAGGPAIAFQLLVYPATDLTRSLPSHTENGEGYLLDTDAMTWFVGNYLADADAAAPGRVAVVRRRSRGPAARARGDRRVRSVARRGRGVRRAAARRGRRRRPHLATTA